MNTLHGGFVGYDQANWTVVSHTTNSITFSFYDEHMSGFPGDVLNMASYTLTDDQAFISRLVSIPVNEATPIMLANHIYWNLGAFVTEDAKTILNDTLYMPYADRYIQTDGILIPNGSIGLTNGTALDFTKPTKLGPNLEKADGFCGTGCTGIDNAFITDRSPYAAPKDPGLKVLQLSSPVTGIQMDLETNMGGLQIYSCVGQNGTIPVKESQQHIQGNTTYVEKYGCIVIEAQDVSILNCGCWNSACADSFCSGLTESTTQNGDVMPTRSFRLLASHQSTTRSTSSALRSKRTIKSMGRGWL